jgi:hypothetical protein
VQDRRRLKQAASFVVAFAEKSIGAMFPDILGFVSEFSPFGAARSTRCSPSLTSTEFCPLGA